MKHLSSLMLILSAIILLSCHSTKSSVSQSKKSETVASTAHRLCSSWINDTTSQRLVLSADSMFFVFSNSENTFFEQEVSNGFSILAGSESISPGDAAAASPDDMYLFSSKPPSKGNSKAQEKTNAKGHRKASARRLTEQPKALKIYGLHVDAGNNKKSSVHASSVDSEATATQSNIIEEARHQKSIPSNSPKWIFFCLVALILGYFLYKIRT
jgi:hypothetical protein